MLDSGNKSVNKIIDDAKLKTEFENSLAFAVNKAYKFLADLEFKDLDTDTVYVFKFDNIQQKWLIEIKDSKEAEVSLEEKNFLAKDDTVVKIISKLVNFIFEQTKPLYITHVFPMIERGNFLKVDETKAEALKDILEDRESKTAFEKITFLK